MTESNIPFSFDTSIQVFNEKVYDNFGEMCLYQHPNYMVQNKKGTISLKTNLVFSLNLDRLKQT